MIGYKGFDKDFKCRDMQYEVGKTYIEKEAKLCKKGLHFCENPLDVFTYYSPNDGKFAEIEADSRHYRVDVLQCPYMKYCKLLGCKELTVTFCLSGNRVYGNMCGITFERQGTIGRGHDKCVGHAQAQCPRQIRNGAHGALHKQHA